MTTARIPLGVEVSRLAGRGGAADWTVVRLRPGARHLPDWTVLAETEGATHFYAGTADLILRAADAAAYAALLAAAEPSVSVVLDRSEAAPGWKLRSVSLLTESAGEAPDALRGSLPIPAGLRGWIAEFSRHHDARPSDKAEAAAAPDQPEHFLGRWSRLKQRRVIPPAEPSPAQPVAASPDLPPLESLASRAEYTAFLREAVSPALRIAALRRAWVSDPAIAGHKPLVDYDWNFNAPGYGKLLPADDPGKLVETLFRHLREGAAAEPQDGPDEAPAGPDEDGSLARTDPGEDDRPPASPRRHGRATPA